MVLMANVENKKEYNMEQWWCLKMIAGLGFREGIIFKNDRVVMILWNDCRGCVDCGCSQHMHSIDVAYECLA